MAKRRGRTQPHTLTIEFAGICTLLWHRKQKVAEVRLVDLASAGFQRHHAALSITATANSLQGVTGPDADVAATLADQDAELGIWDLRGADVTIVVDHEEEEKGRLEVDDGKIDPKKKPTTKASSVRWLPELKQICEATRPSHTCPSIALLHLRAGTLTAKGPMPRKFGFTDDQGVVVPERWFLPRFQVAIPFQHEVALRLTRERVLRFTQSNALMVSNTCVCGLGDGRKGVRPDHFYGHYFAVNAHRRPVIRTGISSGPAGGGGGGVVAAGAAAAPAGPIMASPLIASNPEYCWGAFADF